MEERLTVGDLLGGKVEVMGASFHGNRQAFGFCGAQQVQGMAGGEMNDMEAELVFAAEREKKSDGGELGFIRAGLQVGGVFRPVGGV